MSPYPRWPQQTALTNSSNKPKCIALSVYAPLNFKERLWGKTSSRLSINWDWCRWKFQWEWRACAQGVTTWIMWLWKCKERERETGVVWAEVALVQQWSYLPCTDVFLCLFLRLCSVHTQVCCVHVCEWSLSLRPLSWKGPYHMQNTMQEKQQIGWLQHFCYTLGWSEISQMLHLKRPAEYDIMTYRNEPEKRYTCAGW